MFLIRHLNNRIKNVQFILLLFINNLNCLLKSVLNFNTLINIFLRIRISTE